MGELDISPVLLLEIGSWVGKHGEMACFGG